jgi:hypothetical protein
MGALKHRLFHYINIKMVPVLFYYQNNIKLNPCFLHLSYLVPAASHNCYNASGSGNGLITPIKYKSVSIDCQMSSTVYNLSSKLSYL